MPPLDLGHSGDQIAQLVSVQFRDRGEAVHRQSVEAIDDAAFDAGEQARRKKRRSAIRAGVRFLVLNEAKQDSFAPPVLSFTVAVDALKGTHFAKGNRLQQIGDSKRQAKRQAEARRKPRPAPAASRRRTKA
jgi:hypothetical protein